MIPRFKCFRGPTACLLGWVFMGSKRPWFGVPGVRLSYPCGQALGVRSLHGSLGNQPQLSDLPAFWLKNTQSPHPLRTPPPPTFLGRWQGQTCKVSGTVPSTEVTFSPQSHVFVTEDSGREEGNEMTKPRTGAQWSPLLLRKKCAEMPSGCLQPQAVPNPICTMVFFPIHTHLW